MGILGAFTQRGGDARSLSNELLTPNEGCSSLSKQKRLARRIMSDADEQLIIEIPLKVPSMVTGIEFSLDMEGDPKSNPKTIKVYKNIQHIDFTNVDDVKVTHTLDCGLPSAADIETLKKDKHSDFSKSGLVVMRFDLPPAKFRSTSRLTLFVQDNHGAQKTVLRELSLIARVQV